jgi:Uma2 family endonuclease
MVAAAPIRPLLHGEDRVLIHDVPWATYVVLRDSLDERGSSVHLTYLEGALELMSPSDEHESSKSLIGRLVIAYAEEHDIDLDAHGSTTHRSERDKRGLEPDESYTIGGRKPVPDIAIEVVISAPKLDKLEVYRGLGVPEVWVYRDGKMTVWVLGEAGYEARARSEKLPGLDLDLLVSFVRIDERQTKLVKEYRAALRSG